MSSIVTAVFKATIGLLVNKGRDKAAEKLKDGDLTDQRIRELIVREIDDIKSKLDGLARKDLLTSISYFKRGIAYLLELLNKAESGKNGPENSSKVGLHLTATGVTGETVSFITEGLKNMKVTYLDDADKRALSNAKEEFKVACLKATEAFNNEALSTSDRIQAMIIRVAATVLEKVDHPEDAIAACKLCLEELHSMPAVQGSFAIEFKQGFWAMFSKAERREIIFTVYRLNRVVYDVIQIVYGNEKWTSNWPCVDFREGTVYVLHDSRVAEILRKHGVGHFWKPEAFSFGRHGYHRFEAPVAITTNTDRHVIVAHYELKVFDCYGNFLHCLDPPTDDNIKIYDVATDKNDNIYALVEVNPISFPVSDTFELSEVEFCVCRFGKSGELPFKFPLTVRHWYHSLAVSDNDKVLVLGKGNYFSAKDAVDVFKTDGEFVRSFGEERLSWGYDITAANDGHVMVLDRARVGSVIKVFSDEGHHLFEFELEASSICTKIAFNRWNEHVVVGGQDKWFIYNNRGRFVRDWKIDAKTRVQGIAFVSEHHIAVACDKCKILVFSSN